MLTKNRICLLLAVLCLAALLSACGKEESPTPQSPEPAAEEIKPDDSPLAAFRQEMQPPVMAVALLTDDYTQPLDELIPWMETEYPHWLNQHAFIRDIPQERIIGTHGSLFCVVPRDPLATVVVNRVIPAQNTPYPVEEVLYRSESGEPILLFPETEQSRIITITVLSEDGTGVEYWPDQDMIVQNFPKDAYRNLILDFSPVPVFYANDPVPVETTPAPSDVPVEVDWRLPDLSELENTFWLSQETGYALELSGDSVPGNNGGSAAIYDVGSIGEYTKSYSGSWQLEGERIYLSLVPETDDGVMVDDSFPILIRREELWIGRNGNGIALPHFASDQMIDILEQPKG